MRGAQPARATDLFALRIAGVEIRRLGQINVVVPELIKDERLEQPLAAERCRAAALAN